MKRLLLAAALLLSTNATAQYAEPAAAPAPAPAAQAEGAPYGKVSGIIPGMVIGPKLNLLTLSPGIGIEAKIGGQLGVSVDYGLWPQTTMAGDEVDVTIDMKDLRAGVRYFVTGKAFFVGAEIGRRTFTFEATNTVGDYANLDVVSTYVAPEIGWRFVQPSGLFFGFDLGYQIMLSSKNTLKSNLIPSAQTRQDVEDAGDALGKAGLPVLGLLSLGYFF
jgi:hypothetical protein